MNCWDVLGIEPTGDVSRIESAYHQQVKFATTEDARELERAMHEALELAGASPRASRAAQPHPTPADSSAQQPLTAAEHQVVREVVIQVRALLNDTGRCSDPAIWRAILTEPPADKPAVRYQVAEALEAQLRPMAKQGGLSVGVADFLGKWFNWSELADLPEESAQEYVPGASAADQADGLERAEAGDKQNMSSFWPAAIGWIIGLVVLTSLFSNMTGS